MKLGDWTFRAFSDGAFKLDGGSMFGVVPRVMWERQHEPDEFNRIDLALRCLLADNGERRVLVDVGLGDRWSGKHRKIFAIERQEGHLVRELAAAGVAADSITDVVLTHLHFDHAGGALCGDAEKPEATFPKARYWVQKQHWNWAMQPTERDRASFRPDDFRWLEDLGLLELVEGRQEIIPEVQVTPVNGHTPGQQIVEFHSGAGTLVYCADLIPFASQVDVPWIMSYDMNPLLTVSEKKSFLSRAVEESYVLVFEHDPLVEACTVRFEEGRFCVGKKLSLSED